LLADLRDGTLDELDEFYSAFILAHSRLGCGNRITLAARSLTISMRCLSYYTNAGSRPGFRGFLAFANQAPAELEEAMGKPCRSWRMR
jgi:hypothetical protein